MTMTDAFHVRVITLALDNAEDSAKRLERNVWRECVQESIARVRDELRRYEESTKPWTQ